MPLRLIAYIDSIVARDPAPRSRWEVLLYPGVWALAGHRVARAGQTAQQRATDRGIIFDDEHASHGGYATRSMGRNR